MIISTRAAVLSLGFAIASTLGVSSAAQAVVCSDTHSVTFDTSFIDCAGNQNSLDLLPGGRALLGHNQGIDGPHAGTDWFTDLHITFTDAEVAQLGDNVDLGEAFLVNNGVGSGVDWLLEGDLVDDVSFIAPSFGDRVNPGDLYNFTVDVYGDFSSLTGLNIHVEYTMDVPEPGSLALLAGLLLPLGLAAHARRKN